MTLLSINEQMSRLAEAFPGLVHVPGVRPWDAERLRAWMLASDAAASLSQPCHAARFVLSVWNPFRSSKDPAMRFDVHAAIYAWDGAHRAAFAAWACAPFYP